MDAVPEPASQRQLAPRRHLAGGAIASVAADIGPLVAGGVLSIVLARAIGPAGNGQYALLATVVNVAVLIFSMGLSAGITYEVSRGSWPLARAFRQSYVAAVVLGVAGSAAGLGFYVITRHDVLRSFDVSTVIVALAAVPALLAVQFACALLLGANRYEGYATVQLASAGVTLVVGGALAIAYGLAGAIVGFTSASLCSALVGVVLLRRRRATDPVARGDGGEAFRRAARFGLPGWIGNIFQQANYRFDVLILAGYAATREVGVYSVALTLTSVAWVLPHGLQMVLFPRTADLDAAAEAGEITAAESDAAVTRGTRHSVLLLLPAGLIVALMLAAVPLVYGRRFDQTVLLGFVLLPGVLTLGAGKVLASVVAGRGAPRYNLYTSMLTAIITMVLYFSLIPAFGAWGAAIGSSLSYVITSLITAIFFRRLLRIPLRDALVPTRADLMNYPEAFNMWRTQLRARRASRQAAHS